MEFFYWRTLFINFVAFRRTSFLRISAFVLMLLTTATVYYMSHEFLSHLMLYNDDTCDYSLPARRYAMALCPCLCLPATGRYCVKQDTTFTA